MNTPKKQHYIPKFWLKNFTNNSEKIFLWNKRDALNEIRDYSITEAFSQNYLNSYIDDHENKDHSLEHEFATLDDEISIIFNKIIIPNMEKGLTPEISDQQKKSLDLFMYQQRSRAPEAFDDLLTDNVYEKFIDDSIQADRESGIEISDLEEAEIKSEKTKKRIQQNAKVQARSQKNSMTVKLFNRMSVGISPIIKNNKSYIIGSQPIAEIIYGNGLGFWVPISPKYCITYLHSNNKITILPPHTDDYIRKINLKIYKQYIVSGSHSKILLSSLINSK